MANRVLSFDMGSRSMGFALVDAPDKIIRMGVMDLHKNVARPATENLVASLLTENDWMLAPEHDVVVESQPSAGVPKVLSYVLLSVFRTVDAIRGNQIREFRFMAARSKLRLVSGDNSETKTTAPETYAQRKALAVTMAERILDNNDSKFREFFRAQKSKQRSDIADALVQACRHLQERATT